MGWFAIPFVLLCAAGVGLSLWGRFAWPEISSWLAIAGTAAREIGGAAERLKAFVSGLLLLAFGGILGRMTWAIFGSSLLTFQGGIWEIAGWCFVVGSAMCLAKGAADWSVAFKGAATLQNEHVHGDARLATDTEAAGAARGNPSGPAPVGNNSFNY